MKNKILIGIGILIAVILFSGCIKSQPPATTPPPAGEKEIPFTTIEKGTNSYYSQKRNFVIDDAEKWDGIWNNLKGCPTCGKSKPPDVDFSKETVIAVFMGEKNTGGYSIEITKIIDTGNNVIVFVNETSPKPGDIVTQALTQPYHIVRVEKRIQAPSVEFQTI